jgi:hypothetical protein
MIGLRISYDFKDYWLGSRNAVMLREHKAVELPSFSASPLQA